MVFVDDFLGVVGPTVTREVNFVVIDVCLEDGFIVDLIVEKDEETPEVVFIEDFGTVVLGVVNSVEEVLDKVIDAGFTVDLNVGKELKT